jgi:hypothetical protein
MGSGSDLAQVFSKTKPVEIREEVMVGKQFPLPCWKRFMTTFAPQTLMPPGFPSPRWDHCCKTVFLYLKMIPKSTKTKSKRRIFNNRWDTHKWSSVHYNYFSRSVKKVEKRRGVDFEGVDALSYSHIYIELLNQSVSLYYCIIEQNVSRMNYLNLCLSDKR